MKIGYARVSTRDQKLDLQVDALKRAGCERIYQDVVSGSKAARPALDDLLSQLRAGDVLVIWKLDRMGRSLRHLVELVGDLVTREVGLLSLNDPLDTTSAQVRLVFNLFASLAEFERELIRERTQAGLSAARARGRVGGRPKGLPAQADTSPRARCTATCANGASKSATMYAKTAQNACSEPRPPTLSRFTVPLLPRTPARAPPLNAAHQVSSNS